MYVMLDSPKELPELAKWFRADADLRGDSRLVGQSIEAGEMGAAFDAVAIAVGSGGMVTVAIHSLFTWLSQRQKDKSVHIKLKRDDGQEASVDVVGVSDPEKLIAEITLFFKNSG
jgi:hypothetical protein